MVRILHGLFLELQMRAVVIFVFVLLHINDVVFQVRTVIFLEKFYLLYNQVS